MILIIGAGISGISAAKNLKNDFLILEKEGYIGGLSTQYKSKQYFFDYGGHYFHFKDKPEIKEYLEKFADFKKYKRNSKVYVLDKYIPFPLQFHLSYLPSRIKNEILKEILNRTEKQSNNLCEFIENNFGKKLSELFFKPFLSKYYCFDLKKIIPNMDKGSIPIPDKTSVIQGFNGKEFLKIGYNPNFYYPEKSLKEFFNNYSKDVKNNIILNEEALSIDINKKTVKTKNNVFQYKYLINSMPLKKILQIIKQKDNFPSYTKLSNTSTLVTNIVLKKKRKYFHWVYLPENKFPFYRIGFYPSKEIPVCYLEKTVINKIKHNKANLLKDTIITLKKLNLIENKNEILYFDTKVIPISYIIFDENWKNVVPQTIEKLKYFGIFSIGRYGAWNYTSMSDDVKSAIITANTINSLY